MQVCHLAPVIPCISLVLDLSAHAQGAAPPANRRIFQRLTGELTCAYTAGGRVRVKVSSKDIHQAFPKTKIVVRAVNLHAPLIDRLLEIPMDIHEGVQYSLLFSPLTRCPPIMCHEAHASDHQLLEAMEVTCICQPQEATASLPLAH